MKKILLVVIALSFCYAANADVVLYRYTSKATGNEMGICYSDKDGNSAHNNPDWTVEVIPESQKDYYIKEQRKQQKAKEKIAEDSLKAKRKEIKKKLKAGTPLTDDELEELVGAS